MSFVKIGTGHYNLALLAGVEPTRMNPDPSNIDSKPVDGFLLSFSGVIMKVPTYDPHEVASIKTWISDHSRPFEP